MTEIAHRFAKDAETLCEETIEALEHATRLARHFEHEAGGILAGVRLAGVRLPCPATQAQGDVVAGLGAIAVLTGKAQDNAEALEKAIKELTRADSHGTDCTDETAREAAGVTEIERRSEKDAEALRADVRDALESIGYLARHFEHEAGCLLPDSDHFVRDRGAIATALGAIAVVAETARESAEMLEKASIDQLTEGR